MMSALVMDSSIARGRANLASTRKTAVHGRTVGMTGQRHPKATPRCMGSKVAFS
jgi:hypothetical protein